MSKTILLAAVLLAGTVHGQGIITTVAGGGKAGLGDGGPATSATLNFPSSVAVDLAGNLYIADMFNHRIRKVNPAGLITTVAGTGRKGFSGDGGAAASADLALSPDSIWTQYTGSVAVSEEGELYIADSGNNRIRKVGLNGIITTVAGNGTGGFAGDGGLAVSAALKNPGSVAVAPGGALIIADTGNGAIRSVDSNGGIQTVLAGLRGLVGLAIYRYIAADNTTRFSIYASDGGVVRGVYTAGGSFIYAGGRPCASTGVLGDGGPPDNAVLSPWGLAAGQDGNLYIADSRFNRIRRVTERGVAILTVAGTGNVDSTCDASQGGFSGDGGPATQAQLQSPLGVAVDQGGNIYIADAGNNRIRKISLPANTPRFTDVVNGADFAPNGYQGQVRGPTFGAIATIFGTNLTNVSGIVSAGRFPLPTELSGTRVEIGGRPTRLFAVANVNGLEQINFQVPFDASCVVQYFNDDFCSALFVVVNNGISSPPVAGYVLGQQPGIFTVDGHTGAILHGSTDQHVSASSPAQKGEVVAMFATGLGYVNPFPPEGTPASASPLSYTTFPLIVSVGGKRAEVLFSGLAPGFVGLNQINLRVPLDVPSGSLDVTIFGYSGTSKPAKLEVN